jgi:hypothetical protein
MGLSSIKIIFLMKKISVSRHRQLTTSQEAAKLLPHFTCCNSRRLMIPLNSMICSLRLASCSRLIDNYGKVNSKKKSS